MYQTLELIFKKTPSTKSSPQIFFFFSDKENESKGPTLRDMQREGWHLPIVSQSYVGEFENRYGLRTQ